MLRILPCVDSDVLASARRRELHIARDVAAALGRSAVEAAHVGSYVSQSGRDVDWSSPLQRARASKRSISPDVALPKAPAPALAETLVQVRNETTLQASQRLTARGLRPLALNFANGATIGGGFLNGARAQEEVLCRSSALYQTLVGDPMYEAHRRRPRPDSTDWAIHSPDVPVFRTDEGAALDEPWPLSIISCAAPYAPTVGQPESGDLLRSRITRVLSIAGSFGYSVLVLGAWGCGAFENDPRRTAADFRDALETDFAGVFSEITFAITDWSAERKTLGPFRDVFAD